MKAVIIREFGPPETHRVEEVQDPLLGPDEVLIDVRAAAVNFPDLLVIEGKYQILPSRPFTPGKDAAGVVVALGDKVTSLRVGQRVQVQLEHGAYASRVAAPALQCHLMPDEMSFVEAAAMGLVYQTAYFGLIDRAQFKAGETVLINGAAGGVGLAAVQIVKGLGGMVLAAVNNPEQSKLVLSHGVDHVIDLSGTDLRDSVRSQVHAATSGRGADVVLDTLGGDVFDGSLRALAWCGRLVVIGFAAGRIPDIKANYLLVKNISVLGLHWSDYRERQPQRVAQVHDELMKLYRAKAIRPEVMKTFPLEQYAQAMKLVQSGQALGKIVLSLRTDQ